MTLRAKSGQKCTYHCFFFFANTDFYSLCLSLLSLRNVKILFSPLIFSLKLASFHSFVIHGVFHFFNGSFHSFQTLLYVFVTVTLSLFFLCFCILFLVHFVRLFNCCLNVRFLHREASERNSYTIREVQIA